MQEIDMIISEFDESMKSFKEAKVLNNFHEASDIYSYMLGLIKSAQIIYVFKDLSIEDNDFKTIEARLSQLDQIENPIQPKNQDVNENRID